MKRYVLNILKIKSVTSAYQLFQVLRFSVLVLISILLVKLSYSPEETSVFELFLFSVNLFTFFWVSGIGNAILSWYPRIDEKSKTNFFGDIFFLLQSIGLITAVLFYLFNGFGVLSDIKTGQITLFVSIYIAFYSPTILVELYYILFHFKKKLIYYGLIIYLFQLIPVVVAASVYNDLYYVFSALLVWIILRWLWTIKVIFFENSYTFKLRFTITGQFLFFSLPIIIHMLFSNGSEFIDGLLVENFFPPDQFSLYRYGAREFPLILVLVGAIRTTMIPMAVNDLDSAMETTRKSVSKLMHIFFPLAIILLFTSKYLFSFFYDSDYTYSALLFNIYLLTICSRFILSEIFIYSSGRNKIFIIVSLLEIILNFILSIILMKYLGLAGIAYGTFLAFLISKIYLVYYVKNKIGQELSKYLNLRVYFGYTLLLIVSFLISYILIF
ncbi:MAG: polysaccharide biosynthesis C-terminal domain-containing protein [Saprospiraceae bacterium]|nr:polysaccharide biosynthesis C-terminal domain-containing protein [Saprospiraceae bacterium]